MFEIVKSTWLVEGIRRIRVRAPRVARKRRAGQFVIVRVHERGERIPLTIADSDPALGTITLVVQGVGKTTMTLNLLEAGDSIPDVAGPLGLPSEVASFGHVVVVGGGVGTAIAYPTAVAMREAGNRVTAIVGAQSRDRMILEAEMRSVADRLFLMTDDGSYGEHGLVTRKLQELIEREGEPIDRVVAVGPVPMMRAVAELTRPHGITTIASLNPLMVDGTGMCGGCRVTVGGQSRFACVDGPEFDAHAVDFTELMQRNRSYEDQEQRARREFEADPDAGLAAVRGCAAEVEVGTGTHPPL